MDGPLMEGKRGISPSNIIVASGHGIPCKKGFLNPYVFLAKAVASSFGTKIQNYPFVILGPPYTVFRVRGLRGHFMPSTHLSCNKVHIIFLFNKRRGDTGVGAALHVSHVLVHVALIVSDLFFLLNLSDAITSLYDL